RLLARTPRSSCVISLPILLQCSRDHRDLHSFPTRRSSDLGGSKYIASRLTAIQAVTHFSGRSPPEILPRPPLTWPGRPVLRQQRSEEHTSELQSRENLVCRLLLEKKN